MPSRAVVATILLFWVGTVGFVAHRDVWPRLSASGPPPIAVDVADEASQLLPVRWVVLRGEQKVGQLTTRMRYVDADDTFQFISHYSQVQFDFGSAGTVTAWVRILVPELTTIARISRAGQLREQNMAGQLVVQVGRFRDGEEVYETIDRVRAQVTGRVDNGFFLGRCELDSALAVVKRDLEPVPVPEGQALNPLQPVNRIANLHPGQRWIVHEIDPLAEAVGALFKRIGEIGFSLPDKNRDPLIARVSANPQVLFWHGHEVSCWTIEYRNDRVRARTWVRTSDDKVIRQEAFSEDEQIALEREE